MLKNNRFSIIFLLLVPVLIGISCEKKFRDQLTFDEIGFTVKNYSILPKQDLLVEAVNINTPSGFRSITTELSGQGDLSEALRIPAVGNEEKGYARFMYTAPDEEITASVTITVLENDGTKHVRTVIIDVQQKRNFPSPADFLANTRYKFNDLYHIAKASKWWTTDSVKNAEALGFKSPLWQGTFFTVPDGALDPLIDLIAAENAVINSWSDLDPSNPIHLNIANNIIESLNMSSRLASGTRAFPPDSIGKDDYPNGYRLFSNTFGYMKVNVSDFTVGRVGRSVNPETGVQPGVYYPQAKIQAEYDTVRQDSVLYSFRMGGGYGYNLNDFFIDLELLDGAFHPEKNLRANNILIMMGFDGITLAGMNGFDPIYTLSAARTNFWGSAYWRGTLFVPYNDLVAATYESVNTANGWGITSFTEEWNWHLRADIPEDQMEFMMNFWGSHNLQNVTDKSLSGAYASNNGTETLVVVGNTVSRVENEEIVASAKILKSVRFFDGEDDVFKVIHVIDDVLWLP